VTAIGAAYFGIIGALIGVPIAAAIYGVMVYLRGPIDDEAIKPTEAEEVPDEVS
jgi:predicted PurR-regulated permease PerM